MYKKIKIDSKTIKSWKKLPNVSYKIELNPRLIKSQSLDRIGVGILFGLHGQKCYIFNEAKDILESAAKKGSLLIKPQKRMADIKEEIQELEYVAQEAWEFKQDSNYHNWWLDLPGCTCPKLDNYDLSGVDRKIYNITCPWHGKLN